MALTLPERRQLRQIQLQRQPVPIDQIIQVMGESPVANGITQAGASIGQALSRRAELKRQGQQLSKLESLSGQPAGAFTGLDPSVAANITESEMKRKADAAIKDEGNYTPEQTAAMAGGDLKLLPSVFPRGVPQGAATLSATIGNRAQGMDFKKQSAEDRKLATEERTTKDINTRWEKLAKESNPNTASSRSALGMAAIGNVKANRALPILARPDATNQDMSAVAHDFDSILTGGAPTDAGTHSIEYDTLAKKWANLQTYLTSQPNAVATPEIKQHMSDLINEMKQVNAKTVNDNFDYEEMAHPDLIAAKKDAWGKMRSKFSPGGGLQPLPVPGADPGNSTIGRFKVTVH